MSGPSEIREDLYPADIEPTIRLIVREKYSGIKDATNKVGARSTSPFNAKTLDDTIDFVERAIRDYERREHVTADRKVNFSYEDPNKPEDLELITVEPSLIKPGAYEKTHPTQSSATIRNLAPTMREELQDPDHPGYHRLILGYFYDNWLTFTCWARTGKAAHNRATWLENLIEEYAWFFTAAGIQRIIYQGRGKKITRDIHNNLIVGYPLEYYVRTERLINVSEKTLEQVIIELDVATS